MKHATPILNQLIHIAICSGLVISCFGCSPKTTEPASTATTSTAAPTAPDATTAPDVPTPTNAADIQANTKADANPVNVADIQAKNEELLHAAAEGKVDRVRALIAEGADVNAKDKDGFPALEVATAFAQADVVKALIDAGADVNIVSGISKRTPLFAFSMGDTESDNHEAQTLPIVNKLIAAKANVNYKDPNGVTALETAAALGYSTIAEALIAAGADVNAKDRMNFSPLHAAASQHKLKTIEVLVKAGADVNAVTSEETHLNTPLLMAAESPKNLTDACKPVEGIEGAFDCSQARDMLMDFSDGLKILLDAGANPNLANDKGITPLMLASVAGYLEGVKALLKAGADAQALNHHHNTALHYAADCRAAETVCVSISKLIMDAGANIHVVDSDGDTALTIAAKHKRPLLEELFQVAGAKEAK